MGEPKNTELQAEYDALVDLGQTGVYVVKRSQAFKDTGWDPTEAAMTGGVVDGRQRFVWNPGRVARGVEPGRQFARCARVVCGNFQGHAECLGVDALKSIVLLNRAGSAASRSEEGERVQCVTGKHGHW